MRSTRAARRSRTRCAPTTTTRSPIQNVEVVGPTVGHQLEKQAGLATLYSLLGMLVYLWFRFQLIYGVAAVVACFHDTLITVGAFALTSREISLTVIAAILTLVGYSMNDTIVVFDRIRENLRISRREPLPDLVNRSINQTLSRTVLTSGLTFLTVLSLYIFGGQVLKGFSFALVIGILIGTYSSIAVAAPMLVAYQEWRAKKGKTVACRRRSEVARAVKRGNLWLSLKFLCLWVSQHRILLQMNAFVMATELKVSAFGRDGFSEDFQIFVSLLAVMPHLGRNRIVLIR